MGVFRSLSLKKVNVGATQIGCFFSELPDARLPKSSLSATARLPRGSTVSLSNVDQSNIDNSLLCMNANGCNQELDVLLDAAFFCLW